MRILLTRPQRDSEMLAEILSTCGHSCILSPVLEIHPQAWDFPSGAFDALILTSHHAVSEQHREKLQTIPCYCIGSKTAETAHHAGFQMIAHFSGDRAALVDKVVADGRRQVLFLSGHQERADLVAELARVGVQAKKQRVYEARACAQLTAQAQQALAEKAIDWALLFSPRSASIFCALHDAVPGAARHSLRLACLSPAVAEACGTGWQQIAIADKPTARHLLAAAGLVCDSASPLLKDMS